MCVCVCARARVCARACVCESLCVRACVRALVLYALNFDKYVFVENVYGLYGLGPVRVRRSKYSLLLLLNLTRITVCLIAVKRIIPIHTIAQQRGNLTSVTVYLIVVKQIIPIHTLSQ